MTKAIAWLIGGIAGVLVFDAITSEPLPYFVMSGMWGWIWTDLLYNRDDHR